ncbi:GTPase [Burkholderia pseudomallei]|uniref:GTPase n=1 Tax=Burkholderia pseudomallei TaxID=28450 RepID=UPI001A9F7327|nr:GTPase [Burkholderia pseudomallei]QTB44321.1 GTPase [Burkholderia pseudomallei]QTB67311.1 GTPase [Burkholderia pseudomallei]
MDHAALRTQLPALVGPFLPRNVRSFNYRIYDDQPAVSALGFVIDPQPFEGKVIAKTDLAIIVQTARAQFAVVARHLASHDPDEGTKVAVTPYARHHFDGTRLDAPVEETRQTADGQTYTVQSVILGGSTTKLPVPKPRCAELAELIEQLEQLPAPDRFRRISHLLVDAFAHDFVCVDPEPEDIIATPPSIAFSVETAKFDGRVTVLYDRSLDVYAIELHRDGTVVDRVDLVYVDTLGEVLERLIDDGHWRAIRIDVLAQPSRKRCA